MKIAIATENGQVSGHFGHCPHYLMAEVSEDRQLVSKTLVPNPGHEPCVLPEKLAALGVNVVIAGGMGMRAQQNFANFGIQTVLGIAGELDQVLQAWLEGTLQPGESTCDHGTCGG
jgi:predicted Fe-Mo cluster-binding NifX family protein